MDWIWLLVAEAGILVVYVSVEVQHAKKGHRSWKWAEFLARYL